MNVISQGNLVQQMLGGVYTVLTPGHESDPSLAPWRPEPAVGTQAEWELGEQEMSGARALVQGGVGRAGGGRGSTRLQVRAGSSRTRSAGQITRYEVPGRGLWTQFGRQ